MVLSKVQLETTGPELMGVPQTEGLAGRWLAPDSHTISNAAIARIIVVTNAVTKVIPTDSSFRQLSCLLGSFSYLLHRTLLIMLLEYAVKKCPHVVAIT